jgi:hypothetical protein
MAKFDPDINAFRKLIRIVLPVFLACLLSFSSLHVQAAEHATGTILSTVSAQDEERNNVNKFISWLSANADSDTQLPFSHVGDERLLNWTLTYDAAVTSLAWIAVHQPKKAQKIIDFYLENEPVWRLGGIIEGVNSTSAVLGEDWSVRTGSNLWMGLAAIRLYQATKNKRDLLLAKRLGDFALSLQDNNPQSGNYGGIPLGPEGGPNVVGDQHLDYDVHEPSFTEIFATEHNIDAYALFGLLFQETKEDKYRIGRENVLHWLKTVAYNPQEHRFNRGARRTLDTAVATDVQSWGVSALGIDVLDSIEPNLAEKMIAFVEDRCMAETEFQKPDGSKVTVRGVDFIDHAAALSSGRQPLVSPEWTFQLINAYQRLASDFSKRGDTIRAARYRQKQEELKRSILKLAIRTSSGWGLPYATQGDALIGHEYRTPIAGTLSTIGPAYGILALTGLDPLVVSPENGTIKAPSGTMDTSSSNTRGLYTAA